MVQIMGGQQANGQCPPVQTHAMHIHGTSAFHQPEYAKYRPDACAQNRHQMIQVYLSHSTSSASRVQAVFLQTGSYPLELLQLMGVEVPPLRRIEYMQSNNGTPSGNWPRRVNTSNNTPVIPSPHFAFRPNNNGLVKKSNWYSKVGKRPPYRDSFGSNENYGSDSGFSSRSPTPNKHQIDSSQTESSDERDSVISSVEQSMK